jgi:diaminopimelate decarboxylase
MVIGEDIGEIHAESALEIDRISAISKRLGKVTSVAVRVNPSEDGQGGAMRMGGKAAPFGVDEEQLPPLLHRIVSDPSLKFIGIHLFVGTQILDYKLLLTQYRKGLEVSKRASEIVGVAIERLDFGGGLGIPYFAGESELDLLNLRDGLKQLMISIQHEPCFASTDFTLEPGRFLAGECGVYVARINDVKVSRGKKFLILDGGMNHHLAASGNLGQVIKRNFPMAILNKLHAPATDIADVVGPLCTPLDTLARSVQLPETEVGDLVGIFQAGAYARSASPLGFLSHPTPPEVWLENGQHLLIRRRGGLEDYTRDVQVLDPVLEFGS